MMKTSIMMVGMESKEWQERDLENESFRVLKRDKRKEVVKNYIFQGTVNMMIPLADIGYLALI